MREERPVALASSPAERYDVLVIGTGMGGATLGYALARAGKKVLFCERGKSTASADALRGKFPEAFRSKSKGSSRQDKELLGRAGRWTDEIEERALEKRRRYVPFLGSGTGGSTALYGMVLERFFPQDFAPRQNFSQASGSSIPEAWPFSYRELEPHYEAAERLYRVRGTPDPCRQDGAGALLPPPPLSASARELFDFFAAKRLHPYRLPSACEELPDCRGCQGFLCDKNCKNDSVRICLEPALALYGARLLTECEVVRMEADRSRVSGVVCRWRGWELTLTADVVVLAAGALETPRILLDSASPDWPNGLANDSGLVGRNLMRHYVDLYAVFPKRKRRFDGNPKELAINDLYFAEGEKMGTLQSFGDLPPVSSLLEEMEKDLREMGSWARLWLFRLAKPLVRAFLNRVSARCVILASLMEDLPYEENRVQLPEKPETGGPRVSIAYRVSEQDRRRIRTFRARIREILKPYRFLLIKQAENNKRLAHVCGTCRSGRDPGSSVLDPYNRAHGLENLYVVDSSFFPSSGGTNPGLTITANALRVADHLIGQWSEKKAEVFEEALR